MSKQVFLGMQAFLHKGNLSEECYKNVNITSIKENIINEEKLSIVFKI